MKHDFTEFSEVEAISNLLLKCLSTIGLPCLTSTWYSLSDGPFTESDTHSDDSALADVMFAMSDSLFTVILSVS